MPSVVRRSAAIGVALSLSIAGAASADTMSADADLVRASVQTFIDLGTAAPGSTIHVDVGFVLFCRNLAHVDPGVTLSITPGGTPQAPAGGSITGTATTLGPVPADWPADGQPCVDDPELAGTDPSHVTIVVPPLGGQTYQYSLGYGRSPSDGLSLATSVGFRVAVPAAPANTPPVLSLPTAMIVEADTTAGWTAAFSASASDAEDDPDPTVGCTLASGAVLPVGSTTISCSATDSAGATASGSFAVTVRDTTAPSLSGMPSDRSVVTADPGGAAVTWSAPSADDVADASPSIGCSPASGSTFPVGTTTVTCTATDASGNHASASFAVSVALLQLSAQFDEPVGSARIVPVANGRTVPVKMRLTRNGEELRSGEVWLWAADCDGSGAARIVRAEWQAGRWMAHLDTTDAPTGCATITVRSGGLTYGGFQLQAEATPVKAKGKSKGG
jgi:hypothetical protein